MRNYNILKNFFFPKLTKAFFIRLLILIIISYTVFSQIIIPIKIDGSSMEPNYQDGSFSFVYRFQYMFSKPQKGDVVTIKFAGLKTLLLKRIVAVAGDEISFVSGKLYINNEYIHEPYLVYDSDWQMAPRHVKKGYVYVVGDNRSMPIKTHKHGMTSTSRLMGGLIF